MEKKTITLVVHFFEGKNKRFLYWAREEYIKKDGEILL